MKIATSLLAGVLFTGALGVFNNAIAADGILSKDESTAASYDHENRPAIQPRTAGTEGSTRENAKTGDIIDRSDSWYGFTSTDCGYLNPK